MLRWPAYFYQFSATHAFLTGLLSFFIPVILWRTHHSLALLAGFISLSGAGFLGFLVLWEKIRTSPFILLTLLGSYIANAVTAVILALGLTGNGVIVILALLNGFYGCFYWLSLRTLFVSRPTMIKNRSVSGNRFGNFQLTVAICLKTGLLLGSLLIGNQQTAWLVLVFSFVLLGIGLTLACTRQTNHPLSAALAAPSVRIMDLRQWATRTGVRPVFVVDGLFLFLESYFWILSLYFLGSQSLSRLGLIVVSLAVLLSFLFFFIKRWIDASHAIRVFRLALVLYAGSWILRALVDDIVQPTLLTATILVIAFTTSFFRLSFNKLFFDRIEPGNALVCILAKSWYTQMGVAIFFGLLALMLMFQGAEPAGSQTLSYIYWCSAPLALFYLLYSRNNAPVHSVADLEI
ncbi:MAG: hypothetical protein OXC07_08570 [Kistimonas sp.]|nr:hypothetical protein [Kistimonas sp.]